MTNTITLYQGDVYTTVCTVYEGTVLNVKDLTGYSAKLYISLKEDSTSDYEVIGNMSFPETGNISFTIPHSISVLLTRPTYYYEIKIYTNSNTDVKTIVKDKINVLRSVSPTVE